MPLWVPESVQRRAQAEYRAHMHEMLQEAYELDILDHWNKELKRFDPHVELVKARDDATHPAFKPGYYHILRRPPVGPPEVLVHETPDGGFREPDSGLYDLLRRSDGWNERAVRDRKKREQELKRAKQKAEEREREERIEEWKDRWNANFRASVSLAKTARPWTQNLNARRDK